MTQFMSAHGYAATPTQRPVRTGLLAGAIAALPALAIVLLPGALKKLGETLGMTAGRAGWLGLLFLAICGAIYGRIFMRTANDRRGGWLFGISYGFLIWMLGPVTVLQAIRGKPVAVGTQAVELLGSFLVYGLVLGVIFPWVHRLLEKQWKDHEPQQSITTRFGHDR